MQQRVVIVDTSNEIAGDGDVPHPAIGRARRMQVPKVALQHDVMIEAVENHMPEVVVIDEIGRLEEALAARTIAERGVQLIATVHGNTLENLLANPTMSDLIGGIGAVTLSDEEARRRGTQKTVLERKAPPTFNVLVEMIERDRLAVRRPVADVVDAILRGQRAQPEIRFRNAQGEIEIEPAPPVFSGRETAFPADADRRFAPRHARRSRGREYSRRQNRTNPLDFDNEADTAPAAQLALHNGVLPDAITPASVVPLRVALDAPLDVARLRRIYPFGVSRSRLARAIKQLGLPLEIARRWQDADAVLLLAGEAGTAPDSSFLQGARDLQLPLVGVRANTYAQILERLSELYGAGDGPSSPREAAVREARDAAQRVLAQATPAELRPQIKPLRRLQHQLAEKYHLRSYSVGHEPNRRVRFLPCVPR